MTTTGNLNITLVEASQNQKEVTINEAYYLIDALLSQGVISQGDTTPPGSPSSGDSYIIGASATGDWASQDGNVGYYVNGWKFITPKEGISLWVRDENKKYSYNNSEWIEDGFFIESSTSFWRPQKKSVVSSALSGATVTESNFIPDRSVVFGLSLRVTTLITGATSFDAGYTSSTGAFGSSIGVALNSTNIGILGNPQSFFSDTDLIYTANGGSFSAGEITADLYYFEFGTP